ncbi:type II secretion system secretin GspD [Candidatus Halobeggiatoa sp. HSG11]|nr:type II secretion system secretin GspD [Candidatus Halobeggiatoa sp. HSG11]
MKIIILLLCTSILLSCSTQQPKKTTTVSAKQLAVNELQTDKVNKPLLDTSIVELPQTKPKPLKTVDKEGKLPEITTITAQTSSGIAHLKLDDDTPIQLDFEQVSLREILQIIGDALEITMIIDSTIGDKVTLRTSEEKPLTKKDLWPLLQLLLNDAGVVMEKRGTLYHLKKTPSQLPDTIGLTPETLTTSDSPEVMQITPLRYITSETAPAIINPLIQPKGRVISLPMLNVIGIVTTPQRLVRINKLLKIIDADPFLHRGMRLFRLVNSKAADVQAELEKILKAVSGNADSTYQVIALERINAILVIAPPNSGFGEVALWVGILDERSEESGEQIFIYKVKNLEAEKLASTLSNVFKIEDKKEAEDIEKQKHNEAAQDEDKKPESLPIAGGKMAVSAELKVNIVSDESTNSLLIRANPRDYRQLLETIYALDQVPKEVMVNVVIAEVTLTEANKFGIDWKYIFGDVNASNVNYAQTDFSVPGHGDKDNSLAGLVFNKTIGSLTALLNIIASTNDISILSRPSLLVRNNEEASINIGASEPFSSSTDRGINSNYVTQSVQYKDTGITVKVTPRINDNGIINLEIFQELSQLGPERGAETKKMQSFIQRKVETSVVVRDGSAIIIGGMIETRTANNKQGLPGLMNVPVLGNTVFSSTDNEIIRTELVLMILPQIVNPEADNRPIIKEFKQRMALVSELLNNEYIFMEKPVPVSTPSQVTE